MGSLVDLLAQRSCTSLELCNLCGTTCALYVMQLLSQDVQVCAPMRSIYAIRYSRYFHELCLFTSCAIKMKKQPIFTNYVHSHGAHTKLLADLKALTKDHCRA